MPSRLSLIAALLLPLAVQAEPADTRALLADSLADSQAQVEAAEQAMRRSENKAVQLYAKRVLTEQQEFDHQLRALAGEKALALPSPRQTERQAAAPGGFDERGFLDAQIRQQDRLVARFEGIARRTSTPPGPRPSPPTARCCWRWSPTRTCRRCRRTSASSRPSTCLAPCCRTIPSAGG